LAAETSREIAWNSIFAGAALAIPILGAGASLYLGVLDKLSSIGNSFIGIEQSVKFTDKRLESFEIEIRQLNEEMRECREQMIQVRSKYHPEK
jgi:hypothetical protein